MKFDYRILVLEDDSNTLDGMVELLREAAYQVTGASTYDAAKRLLALGTFELLITDVRLRGFNGLHLVRQCSIEHPDMAVIIMTGFDEPMLEIEAARYRAEFVRKPIPPRELLGLVARRLSGVRRERRWRRKVVVGGFRVIAHGRPASVVDVSYGGLRLEVPSTWPLPDAFLVEVGGIGLRLPVHVVWRGPSEDGVALQCGAELDDDGAEAAYTWRAIVDRVTA